MLIPHLSENLSLVLLSCSILKKKAADINIESIFTFALQDLEVLINNDEPFRFWDWFVQPPKVKSWIES